jgi:5-methylcytosine-specific restriction endonuclease McrA
MKEQILRLRAEGKSYKQIQEALGCSRGTISYHCGKGQKKKTRERYKKLCQSNPLLKKLSFFKTRLLRFSKLKKHGPCTKLDFNYLDVIEKFGENPKCYLTGDPISYLVKESFNLDHIIPRSRGGTNSLDNLQLATPEANQAKADLLLHEFLELCEKVLKNHGYTVEKNSKIY